MNSTYTVADMYYYTATKLCKHATKRSFFILEPFRNFAQIVLPTPESDSEKFRILRTVTTTMRLATDKGQR